jgi:hypothetical protein
MDRIRLRPIPRSSWSAPSRAADHGVLLAVPRAELLRRNPILGDHRVGPGHLRTAASRQPIDHWLAIQQRRCQRVDRRIVPRHTQRHRERHRPGGRGWSATVRSIGDHGRNRRAGWCDRCPRHARPTWAQTIISTERGDIILRYRLALRVLGRSCNIERDASRRLSLATAIKNNIAGLDAATARSADQPAWLGDPANDRNDLGVFGNDRRLMDAHACF